jgi:membrane protein
MAKAVAIYPVLIAAGAAAGWMLRQSSNTNIAGSAQDPAPSEFATPRGGMKASVSKASDPAEKDAGADATSPAGIPPKGLWHVLKRAGVGFVQDRVMAEAAGVTFYALLALFPAIASFISIYGLFTDPASLNAQLDNLSGIVPSGGLDIIRAQITTLSGHGHGTLGFAAISGLLISLWSANSGVKSLFDALNVVYHEREKRSFIKVTLVAFAITIGGLIFVAFALTGVVVVPIVLSFIGLGSKTGLLLALARWPVMLVVLSVGLAIIYRFGPSRNRARWQWVSWGSVVAAVLWVVVSLLFSFYVAHFGTYDKTYGALGAVVGFMTWIWISSMVVLMGAELNAELEQQTDRDSTTGPEKPIGHRGAFKADVKV